MSLKYIWIQIKQSWKNLWYICIFLNPVFIGFLENQINTEVLPVYLIYVVIVVSEIFIYSILDFLVHKNLGSSRYTRYTKKSYNSYTISEDDFHLAVLKLGIIEDDIERNGFYVKK